MVTSFREIRRLYYDRNLHGGSLKQERRDFNGNLSDLV
jgi:hypothetical protein